MDEASRQLKREWLRAQKETARAGFPLPDDLLEALLVHVEIELENASCDHGRGITERWLIAHGHKLAPVLAWLDEVGGYCDCEVVANAGDHFHRNR